MDQIFSQVPRIDYVETFALTVKKKLLQIYLAICVILGLIIYQLDIIKAYLENLLDDNKFLIYIKPPLSIERMRKKLYWKLLKSLYGLK